MKKLLIMLTLLSVSAVVSAKQYVDYYTYNYFTLSVIKDIKADLDKLISQGYKIISFSFDSSIHAMVVVYDDGR